MARRPRKAAQEQQQEQSDYSARGEQSSFDTEDMNAEQRATMALQLHVMGYTYQQIADKCGYANHSGALKAVKKLRAKLPIMDVRDTTAIQFMRIERGILECMRWMDERPPQDRLWAIDRLVPLLKRQAELMGLDAPKPETGPQQGQMVVIGVPQDVVEAMQRP